MTFPDTALGHTVELLVNGTWTNITGDVHDGQVHIGRGHPDESVTVSPSTLSMTLTDSTGKYSTKNPVSPLYPYLVRNTPLRVSVPAQANYLRMESDQSSGATCPAAAGLAATGDLDLRIDVALTDWQSHALFGTSQPSWQVQLAGSGSPVLFWNDGTSTQSLTATVPLTATWQRFALRVTLALATGTATFYTGPAGGAAGSTWTQLGAAVAFGATTLKSNTGGLFAGEFYGRCYEMQASIAGTVTAHPVFSSQAAGVTSFADAQGNTWTLAGTAEISSRNYRGHFELAELSQHEPPYDPSGGTPDVTVAAAGGGLLRRQSQRSNPVSSAMYRAWTRVASSVLAAYWPMEDGANSTSIGAAAGGQAMTFSGGAVPKLASGSDFACSAALPVVNGSVLTGNVTYAGSWTDNQVAFLMEIPQAGEANNAIIASVTTSGTVALMRLTYGTGGSLNLTGSDSSGTQLFTTGPVVPFDGAVNGRQLLVEIGLQNAGGGNITWSLQTLGPGAGAAGSSTGTVSGTVAKLNRVVLNLNGTLTGTVFGHCAVLTSWQSLFTLDAYTNPYGLQTGALTAWTGEPAGVRFARICSEEGIQFRCRGSLNGTVLMGPQTALTMTALLQECADADRGVWLELRQALGWGYVCRSALYNQAAQVTVDHAQDHLSEWARDPAEDDQVVVNDVTVTQTSGGSSSRKYASASQALTGGRLSTAAPPAGAGTYDQNYSVNLYSAGDLDSEASWILHIGTVDQPRFPGITLDLANRNLSSLFWAVLDMDLGDRLVMSNPPPWLGPDPVSQLAQMLTEELGPFTLTVTAAGVPESPYEVAVIGSFHIDTDGSALALAATPSATSLTVSTAQGFPVWTQNAADFPFDAMVAGERVTVTAIAAAGNALQGADATFDGPSAGHWTGSGGALATVTAVAAPVRSGSGALQVTANATGGSMAVKSATLAQYATLGVRCVPGDVIFAGIFAQAAVTGRTVQAGVLFFDTSGNILASPYNAGTADAAGTWTQTSGQQTAPDGTAYALMQVQVVSAAANEVHYLDDATLVNQTNPDPQVFTVTRSVNGVVKAQAAGAAVNVYPPPVIGL